MKKLISNIKRLSFLIDTPLKRAFWYFLMAFMAGWFHNLENQDELWNYTFANCIANGLYPYRDFNMLQTPFACLVNGIAISIFGHHLLVIRMMGAVLFTGICIVTDRASRKMGAKGIYACFVPSVFLCMFFWNVFLEYSCLIMFFSLCLICFDLEMFTGKKYGICLHVFAGVLAGLAMMCKQTFGTFVAFASWISLFFVCRARKNNYSISKTLKLVFFRMLGTSIPCFIFLFWLLLTDTFGDFWDMCFNGISTFTSSYGYFTFMMENPAYFFLGALLPALGILSLVIFFRYRGTDRAGKTMVVFIYSVFGCINMYPMANSYHVMTCSIPILLLLFTVLPQKVIDSRWLKSMAAVAAVGIACFILIVNPIDDAYFYDLTTDVRGLEFTFMNDEQHEEIAEIDEYIRDKNEEGTTVYILDNFAPLYFIPSNQYHKYLDMFLVGNLGSKTPAECLLETDENSIFLMPDSSRGQYQYPRDDINSFISTLKKVKEFKSFTAYQ